MRDHVPEGVLHDTGNSHLPAGVAAHRAVREADKASRLHLGHVGVLEHPSQLFRRHEVEYRTKSPTDAPSYKHFASRVYTPLGREQQLLQLVGLGLSRRTLAH